MASATRRCGLALSPRVTGRTKAHLSSHQGLRCFGYSIGVLRYLLRGFGPTNRGRSASAALRPSVGCHGVREWVLRAFPRYNLPDSVNKLQGQESKRSSIDYMVGSSYWEDVVLDDSGRPLGQMLWKEGGVFIMEAGDFRALWIDSTLQSVVWLARDERQPCLRQPVFDYIRCMAVAGITGCISSMGENFLKQGTGHQVSVLGVGGGALPMFLSSCLPNVVIEAVELEPLAIKAATEYMGLCTANPHLMVEEESSASGDTSSSTAPIERSGLEVNIHIMDACKWLDVRSDSASGQMSAIFLDCYDGAGLIPQAFRQRDFLQSCLSVLRPGGVLVVNLYDGFEDDLPSTFASSHGFISKVCDLFHSVHLISLRLQPQNNVLLAIKADGSNRNSANLPMTERLFEAAFKVSHPRIPSAFNP
mmetsp:Transcript_20309/g.53079  ORF Transcript_20309/g.53079 Transcript_20309/m.53079 type:complete len:419 (+) Transcript_20309:216-1472(+)